MTTQIIQNVTSEELAKHIADRINIMGLGAQVRIVTSETHHQGHDLVTDSILMTYQLKALRTIAKGLKDFFM